MDDPGSGGRGGALGNPGSGGHGRREGDWLGGIWRRGSVGIVHDGGILDDRGHHLRKGIVLFGIREHRFGRSGGIGGRRYGVALAVKQAPAVILPG